MGEQRSFPFAKKSVLSSDKKKLVRFAYEGALTSAARLASFAYGTPTRTDGPIDERQEELAHDDLIVFAMHVRRLTEITGTKRRFSNVELVSKSKPRLRLLRVLNVIIHHQRIEIIRRRSHLLSLMNAKMDTWQFIAEFENYLPPLVLVRSEEKRVCIFELKELVEGFQKNIAGPVIELCQEQGLYLDEDFAF